MRAFLATWLLVFPGFAQTPNRSPTLKFVLVEGQGAINIVNDNTKRTLVVRVEEKYDAPAKGIRVTFTAPREGPSGLFHNRERTEVAITDDDGYAIVRDFQPNHIAGQYDIQVSATVPAGVINALIPQTNALRSGRRPARQRLVQTVRSMFARLAWR